MSAVTLGDARLTIKELVAIACGARALRLNRKPAFREMRTRKARFIWCSAAALGGPASSPAGTLRDPV